MIPDPGGACRRLGDSNPRNGAGARVRDPDAPAGERNTSGLDADAHAACHLAGARIDAHDLAAVVHRDPKRRAVERHALRAVADRELRRHRAGRIEPVEQVGPVVGHPDEPWREAEEVRVGAGLDELVNTGGRGVEPAHGPVLARDPHAALAEAHELVAVADVRYAEDRARGWIQPPDLVAAV